jgi:hypothetical protein
MFSQLCCAATQCLLSLPLPRISRVLPRCFSGDLAPVARPHVPIAARPFCLACRVRIGMSRCLCIEPYTLRVARANCLGEA